MEHAYVEILSGNEVLLSVHARTLRIYTSLCDVFVYRSSAPPPPDSLGCVSLFLDLLNTLLSCEVRGLTESSPRGEHRHMNRKVVMAMIPKPLLKSIVVKPSGENLLSQLNNDIQV